MKILNLNEGSFPINISMEVDDIGIPNIGKLRRNLIFKAEISKISKNLYKCDGKVEGEFVDRCQNCLENTDLYISSSIDVAIKDKSELLSDSSGQDQTHYQNLEYFDLKKFIEEEVAILYPDIVKCEQECLKKELVQEKEKNLPFKKIRDLIE